MKILVIDDDTELAGAMQPVLKNYSIDLDSAESPESGLEKMRTGDYDLVLLDIMLPGVNGFELCRRIRTSQEGYNSIPIIMLTAMGDLTDLVVGLEAGADDYVTKPFEPRELVARIQAVCRRFSGDRGEAPQKQIEDELFCFRLDAAHLTIDPIRARVFVDRRRLDLTSMEYDLLLVLARQPGEIFSRDDLTLALQGVNRVSSRSIDAIVYRLRHKMRKANADAGFIRTVRGRGYSLIGQPVSELPFDLARERE